MSDYSQDYGLSDYDQDYGLYDYGYNTGDQYQTQFGEEDTYGGEREKVPYGGERKDWDEFSITGSDMGYAGRLSVLDIMALYLLQVMNRLLHQDPTTRRDLTPGRRAVTMNLILETTLTL